MQHLPEFTDPTGFAGQLAVWLMVGSGLMSVVVGCAYAGQRLNAAILNVVGVTVSLLLCGVAAQEPATVRGGFMLVWWAVAIALLAFVQFFTIRLWWGYLRDEFKAVVDVNAVANTFATIVFAGRAVVYMGRGMSEALSFMSLVLFAALVARVVLAVWLFVGIWRSRHVPERSGTSVNGRRLLSDGTMRTYPLQRPGSAPRQRRHRWLRAVVGSLAALGSFQYPIPPQQQPPDPSGRDSEDQ